MRPPSGHGRPSRRGRGAGRGLLLLAALALKGTPPAEVRLLAGDAWVAAGGGPFVFRVAGEAFPLPARIHVAGGAIVEVLDPGRGRTRLRLGERARLCLGRREWQIGSGRLRLIGPGCRLAVLGVRVWAVEGAAEWTVACEGTGEGAHLLVHRGELVGISPVGSGPPAGRERLPAGTAWWTSRLRPQLEPAPWPRLGDREPGTLDGMPRGRRHAPGRPALSVLATARRDGGPGAEERARALLDLLAPAAPSRDVASGSPTGWVRAERARAARAVKALVGPPSRERPWRDALGAALLVAERGEGTLLRRFVAGADPALLIAAATSLELRRAELRPAQRRRLRRWRPGALERTPDLPERDLPRLEGESILRLGEAALRRRLATWEARGAGLADLTRRPRPGAEDTVPPPAAPPRGAVPGGALSFAVRTVLRELAADGARTDALLARRLLREPASEAVHAALVMRGAANGRLVFDALLVLLEGADPGLRERAARTGRRLLGWPAEGFGATVEGVRGGLELLAPTWIPSGRHLLIGS